MSAALLIAAGVLAAGICIATVMLPILQRDMADAVARGTRPPADLTTIALMVVGALLLGGVPASAGLLWATWS